MSYDRRNNSPEVPKTLSRPAGVAVPIPTELADPSIKSVFESKLMSLLPSVAERVEPEKLKFISLSFPK